MFKTLRYGIGQSRKEFILSPYSSEIEREVLIAATVSDDINIDLVFERLKTFIKPYNTNLSLNEKKLILFSLIGISVGEEINSKQICKDCGKPNTNPVIISDLIQSPKNEKDYIQLGKVKFYFKDNYSEFNIYDLINSLEITSEYTPKGIKTIKTKDKSIIKETIDSLSLEEFEALDEFLKDSRTIFKFFYDVTCPFCKSKSRLLLDSEKYIIDCISEDSLVSFYKTVSDMVYYGKYSKEDIYGMIPFERNIYYGLLTAQIEEYKQANPN